MTTKTEGETITGVVAVKSHKDGTPTGLKLQGSDAWLNYSQFNRGRWDEPEKGDSVRLFGKRADNGAYYISGIELLVRHDAQPDAAPDAPDAPWEEPPETPHRAVTDPRDKVLIVRQMSWYAAVQAYALKGPLREGYNTEALFAALKAAAHGIETDILRNV